MRKIYPRDSVWRSQNGQWCYKTFAGGINRFNTEKEARHSKVVWRPQLSRLFKEGVMKKGDKLSLKLAGESSASGIEASSTGSDTGVKSLKKSKGCSQRFASDWALSSLFCEIYSLLSWFKDLLEGK